MIGTLLYDNDKITSPVSAYNPGKETMDLILKIKQDYQVGYDILNTPYREFNDVSVLTRMSEDQKVWNSYTPPASQNPDEKWRWFGVRPITRNKIISMMAQLTSRLLYPKPFAQNDNDEEDRDAAEVMDSLVRFTIENSNYEQTMFYAVMSMLVNPAVILKADWNHIFITIRQKLESGEITKKQVLDEVLSGFATSIVPIDEFYISNIYEFDIQKQRFVGRRRLIDFEEAKNLYGSHPDFRYVSPGIRIFCAEGLGFYESQDPKAPTSVEEFTYYNRGEDRELVFVNGILVSDTPMKHRRIIYRQGELYDVPVYPFAKSGAEPIDEKRFFYYKSVVSKLGPDQALVDRLYRMIMDGTFLSVIPPVVTTGANIISSSVIFPGRVTNLRKDSTVSPLNIGANLTAGFQALTEVKSSLTESSQDNIRSGLLSPGERTAYEVDVANTNAKVQLGLLGRSVAFLIGDFGPLMIDLILRFMTIPEVEETLGGQAKLKYRAFNVSVDENNRKLKKRITFSDFSEMSDKEKEEVRYRMLKDEGGLNSAKRIFMVNPHTFRNLKFKITISADELLPRNEAFERQFKIQVYDRVVRNPLIAQNPEALEEATRSLLLYPLLKSEGDKILKGSAKAMLQTAEGVAPGVGGKIGGEPVAPLQESMV